MKTRIIVAAIFVPIIFVVLFFLPPVWLTIMMAVITAFAGVELLRATHSAVNIRIYIYAVICAVALPFGTYFGVGEITFRTALFLLTAVMFAEGIVAFAKEKRVTFSHILTALFAGIIIPYSLSVLVNLKMLENGRLYVLLPIITTFVSDSGAYFAGKFLGKKKAFPHVSPNKTVEGCAGGLLANIVFMMLYALILTLCGIKVNFGIMAIYGLIGNIATQLGDLAFSFVKREYGIKDYGNLIPGHGGMLDRFDSLTFAAPVICIMVTLFPAF